MGHCEYGRLKDLEPVLNEIRAWEGIRENAPGVFYFKRVPFLHFHSKEDERWADVKDGSGTWGAPVKIAFESSASARKAFLREVKRRYAEMAVGR